MAFGIINAEQLTTQSGYTLGAGNASSFKNRIINGAMVVNQRGSGVLTLTNTAQYAVDQFSANRDSAATCTAQQNTSSLPAGFTNSFLWTTTAGAASAAGDDVVVGNKVEGYNWADFNFGLATASTFTISFWVKSSITGTYGISLSNSAANRCYMATYTVNATNTWEQKTITVAGDTTGTWLTTNGIGLRVFFDLGSGSSRSIAASSVWGATYGTGLTGGVKISQTTGATWNMTGFQIEVGTVATSFDYRSIGTELDLCQRYYQTIDGGICASGNDSSTSCGISVSFPVVMRSSPSAGLTAPLYITRFGSADFSQSSASVSIAAGGGRVTNKGVSLNFNNFTGLPLNTPFPIISSPDPSIGKITLSAEL